MADVWDQAEQQLKGGTSGNVWDQAARLSQQTQETQGGHSIADPNHLSAADIQAIKNVQFSAPPMQPAFDGVKRMVNAKSGKDVAAGVSGVLRGVGQSVAPIALPMGLVAAPLAAIGGLATGAAAQRGTEGVLNAFGAAPEYSHLAGDIAGIAAGTYGGIKAGKIELGSLKPSNWPPVNPKLRFVLAQSKTGKTGTGFYDLLRGTDPAKAASGDPTYHPPAIQWHPQQPIPDIPPVSYRANQPQQSYDIPPLKWNRPQPSDTYTPPPVAWHQQSPTEPTPDVPPVNWDNRFSQQPPQQSPYQAPPLRWPGRGTAQPGQPTVLGQPGGNVVDHAAKFRTNTAVDQKSAAVTKYIVDNKIDFSNELDQARQVNQFANAKGLQWSKLPTIRKAATAAGRQDLVGYIDNLTKWANAAHDYSVKNLGMPGGKQYEGITYDTFKHVMRNLGTPID